MQNMAQVQLGGLSNYMCSMFHITYVFHGSWTSLPQLYDTHMAMDPPLPISRVILGIEAELPSLRAMQHSILEID